MTRLTFAPPPSGSLQDRFGILGRNGGFFRGFLSSNVDREVAIGSICDELRHRSLIE